MYIKTNFYLETEVSQKKFQATFNLQLLHYSGPHAENCNKSVHNRRFLKRTEEEVVWNELKLCMEVYNMYGHILTHNPR